MTGEGTAVIKEPVSATRMIPFFYLVWVMQEVYCIPEQFDSLFFL
ncbi:hypothetical protein [Wolbachia endosymbiont (group A) of Pogonocherus hispidulus]